MCRCYALAGASWLDMSTGEAVGRRGDVSSTNKGFDEGVRPKLDRSRVEQMGLQVRDEEQAKE